MEAGSITFSTALDNKQLEKDLSSLTKKIEKKERDIAELTAKRDEAKGKSLFDGAVLDAENKKLQEIKDRLDEIRARSKDKTLSLEDRDAAKELIPSVKQEYDDQKVRVQGLQAEWNKTEAAVERYNVQLSDAEKELARQKEEAGHIVQQLDEAKNAAGGMGGALERAEEKLSAVLQKLQQQQSVAVEVNKALGDVVDTQTRLTGLAEEFSLGAKIGLVGLAKSAVHVAGLIAQGVPGALKSASSAVSGFSQSVISKIPSLFSKATKFVGELSKKIVGITKNMNVFSKLSDGLSQKFKRLGSTIKSALVFSVIYKGLATVREQMGAYLAVNTQFSTSLRQLQGVLLTAFQPIYDAVLPALTALANGLSQAIAVVSQFTARLFGTTAKQSQKSAEALYNEANALKATGDAAEDAAGSLAGFDEINAIQTEKQGGGGGAAADTGPLFDYEYDETPFDSWGDAFSGFLDILLAGIPKLEAKLSDFAKWLNGFTKKLYDMFTFPGVLEKVQQLGADIANALNNLVLQINWYQLGQALGAGMNLALQFLVNLIYGFDWINLGASLAAMVNGAVSEIDWYAVGQLLWAGFKIAIETLAGFLLGLDMVQLAEAASNLAIGFFNSITETLASIDWEKIGEQIRTFLTSIDWASVATSVSTAISEALSSTSDFFTGLLGEELKNQIRDLFITISKATLVLGAILALTGINIPLGLKLLEIGAMLLATSAIIDWEYMSSNIQKILGEILAIAGASLLVIGLILLCNPATLPLAIGLIAAGAVGLVTAAALNWNAIKEKLQEMWQGIKNWWDRDVKKYFTLEYWKNKGKEIIDGFLDGLKKAWDGLSSWFSGVWDNLFSNRKVSVGVNASSSAGNYNGGSRMAARALPSIAPVSIPALAKGAVIPPNREFMAVLGDQRSGTNIEAPLETIKQALAEVMQSHGGSNVYKFELYVNGRRMAVEMVKEINDMTRQAGKPVLLI